MKNYIFLLEAYTSLGSICNSVTYFSTELHAWLFGCPLHPLSITVPVSINFLCHARSEGRDGRFRPYIVMSFHWVCTSDFVSTNQDTDCAFS